MAGKPVIVLGDKTDHGGTVIEGDTTSTIDGKPMARQGDRVMCPKCKGVFPITTGVANTIFSDKPIAVHGGATACGARLIASQSLVTADESSGEASEGGSAASASDSGYSAGSSSPNARKKPKPTATPKLQTFFWVVDAAGKPVPDMPYSLSAEDGSGIIGETDSEGKTYAAWSGVPVQVELTLNPDKFSKDDDEYHIPNSEPLFL